MYGGWRTITLTNFCEGSPFFYGKSINQVVMLSARTVVQNINGNGLFMHLCDSNHEIAQMQQEEKQQHQRAEIDFMLMKM